jgi:two-component system sensor histidine kinase/response regulator
VEGVARVPWSGKEALAGKGSVLVADDNSTRRRTLAALLRRWGPVTVEAGSGAEALEILQAAAPGEFQAALLDAEMPGASGWDVAEWIASHALRTRAIVLAPVLASRGETPAAAAVVSKPVSIADLWEALTTQTAGQGASDEMSFEPAASSAAPEPRLPGLHILLAEDNGVNRLFGRRLLEKQGHLVTLATDGEAALEAFQETAFDVILMDVQMPGIDGLEATRRIRELERKSGATPVPIIAMTAHAMSGDREVCLEAGMTGYVSKPVNPRELFAAIQAAAGAASR